MSTGRIFFLVLVLLLLAVSAYRITKLLYRKKTSVSRQFLVAEISIAVSLFCCFFITMSMSGRVSLLFYSISFIAIDVYLYTIFRFSLTYTDSRIKLPMHVDPLAYMCIVDILFILAGLWTKSYFRLKEVTSAGEKYIVLSHTKLFEYHRTVVGILLGLAIVVFVIKLCHTVNIYRIKYAVILAALLGILFVDIAVQISGALLLWDTIALSLSSITIGFLATVYAPRRLLSAVLDRVADDIADGIVLFDEEGQLYFTNKSAKNLFNIMSLGTLMDQEFFENWLEASGVRVSENRNIYIVEYRDQTYRVQRSQLQDEKKLIGIYYMLQDLTEETRRLNEANYKARYDLLTDVYNEKYFAEIVSESIRKNSDKRYVLLCTDINQFKMINELFGIKKGDQILKDLAQELRNHFGEEAIYGRVGADRFSVVLPMEEFDLESAERLSHAITEKFDEPSFALIVYMGVYEIRNINNPISVMCDHALLAAEELKGGYIKRIARYGGELSAATQREGKYTAELSRAIANDEIKLFLQPQVDSEGTVVGAEALVRWQHPQDGLLSPFFFVPALERNGRITELDRCMWRQACALLQRWKKQGREDMYISVNISARDCYLTDIYEEFSALVDEYEISPSNIKLEITESAIVNNLERQIALVERLQSRGFVLEMDDFGSAYSSFNMLKDINMDVLKIDMKFLENSENKEKSRTILKSIVALAKAIDMNTVAEGVETKEQFEFLKEIGCEIFQGFYFSKPVVAEVFVQKYIQ